MNLSLPSSILPVPVVVCFLLLAGPAAADTREEIMTALDYYAEMWNEGDVEALRGYYNPDFVLVTPRGIASLAQRFGDIKALAEGDEDRGELSYTNVKIRPLADGHALAYGQMRLQFKDDSSIDSWFSTVYAKTPFGWKAILTHQ